MIERIGFILATVASLAACDPYAAIAPKGFAAFEEHGMFRATSPDGVVFSVRGVDNNPKADLPFWREALKKRMLDSGYSLQRESDIEASGKKGYLLELAAPLGQSDYAYWVGLFASGKKLVLVESAGEVSRFAKHREALLNAVRGVRIR